MSEKCSKDCSNCSDQEKCIPYFDHQNTMMHYNWVNRRSMIIIISVLVMSSITIWILAFNHTQREKVWKDMVESLINRTTVTEVSDGQQKTD